MKRILIVVIVVILLINIIFLIPSTRNFVLGLTDFATSTVNNSYSVIKENDAMKQRNQELEKENQNLKQKNQNLKNSNNVLKQDNDAMKQQFNSRDSSEYNIINARVTLRTLDSWNQVITINKGKNDGVQENNPVTVSDQMVGYVSKVHASSSEVTLLTSLNTNFSIPIKIVDQKKSYDAVINSYNEQTNQLEIQTVYLDSGIHTGDKVYTNGYGKNQPAGIYIGDISKVNNNQTDSKYYVKINPYHFDYVSVVNDEK